MALKKLSVSAVKAITPKQGITNSGELNSAVGSMIIALDSITYQFNTQLVDLINTFPGGGRTVPFEQRTDSPNAFSNGIDGANVFMDASSLITIESGEYFNAQRSRPLTIKEYTSKINSALSGRITRLESSISVLEAIDATGLTDAQKASIGLRIFDPALVSSPTSLDGKVQQVEQYVTQIAADIWNIGDAVGDPLDPTDYSLDGATQTQTISIKEWINALLAPTGDLGTTITYPGGKPSIDYNVIAVVDFQSDVPNSSVYNDSFVGAPTHTEDDLNQIRTEIKTTKGTATWLTALSSLGGGINTLEGLFSFSGTGTPSATNPLGHDLADLDDSTGLLGVLTLTAGESIAQNQFVAFEVGGANNTVYLADASAAGLGTKVDVIGYSVSTGTVTASNPIQIRIVESSLNALGGGGSPGVRYYVDPTSAGDITTTVPSTSGDYLIKVGVAMNANQLLMKISDGVRIA